MLRPVLCGTVAIGAASGAWPAWWNDLCAEFGNTLRWDCADDPCKYHGNFNCTAGGVPTVLDMHGPGNRKDVPHIIGTLPQSIGQLSDITRIDIRCNLLHGTLPDSMGNLSKAAHQLCRSVHMDRSAAKLQHIELRFNNFSGTIPRAVWCGYDQAVQWSISGNSFTRTIPDCLDQLPYVNTFNLGNNGLQGTIPQSITEMK
eukprot:gene6970-6627_t